MRKLFLFLLCTFLFGACSTGQADKDRPRESGNSIPEHLQDIEHLTVLPTDAEPRYEIILVEENRYGDKYDDVVFLGFINDFAVDDRGRVYLSDMSNARIHVYHPDGRYMQSIGREGRGPGEFLTVRGGLDIGLNDEYLFAYDDTNFRITRFSLEDYELVDIVNLDPGKWSQFEGLDGRRPFRLHIRKDNNYLVKFRVFNYTRQDLMQKTRIEAEGTAQYYIFNTDFKPVSGKIYEHAVPPALFIARGGQRRIYTFPFDNAVLTAFSASGRIYEASSDEFLIRYYEPDGEYSRAVYHSREGAPLTEDDLDTIEEQNPFTGEGFNEIDLPKRWPVVNQVSVDDKSRLWISVISADREFTDWWVLDTGGELLGRFQWPRKLLDRPGTNADHYIIKNGALYHLTREGIRLDTQTVKKYRVEMSPV